VILRGRTPARPALRAALAVVIALGPLMAGEAAAQSTRERLDALEARLTQAEQLLQGSALAEMSARIDQLETQLRALRGELETQGAEQAALRKQLADLASELDRRLVVPAAPAAVPGVASVAAPAAEPAAAAAVGPDTLGPVQRYQLAFEALRAADYPKAIAGFDDMIARYPDHALATNARYWLGRSLFLQSDHARAVDAFTAALAGPLESAKAPDALLKKAQSELALGRREAARATVDELLQRYPDSPPARQAAALFASPP
jgi:tol-pal system protein YbgF